MTSYRNSAWCHNEQLFCLFQKYASHQLHIASLWFDVRISQPQPPAVEKYLTSCNSPSPRKVCPVASSVFTSQLMPINGDVHTYDMQTGQERAEHEVSLYRSRWFVKKSVNCILAMHLENSVKTVLYLSKYNWSTLHCANAPKLIPPEGLRSAKPRK